MQNPGPNVFLADAFHFLFDHVWLAPEINLPIVGPEKFGITNDILER